MSVWAPPALVLTAGLGTRLRPLTTYLAKPAMPVGAESLVSRILRQLAAEGVTDAVLNLHHLPATITRDVGDGSQCGLRVRYSWEQPVVLGSGGGPRHALPLFDTDTFLIVNGDTLCDLPMRDLWDAHVSSGALVTLGLMPHPEPGRYGGVMLDGLTEDLASRVRPQPTEAAADDASAAPHPQGKTPSRLAAGAVTGFTSRTDPAPSVHYPGIQIVHRDAFAGMPDDTPAKSVGEVYDRLIAERPGSVHGVVYDARFEDVGTVDDYRRTCLDLAADADGNVLSPTCRVAPGARLRECIVWPGASVPAGCDLHRVIVTGRTALPAGTQAADAIF